jgi:hypothetical protein
MRVNHGCLTAIAIPVLMVCAVWAAIELHVIFYDSEGMRVLAIHSMEEGTIAEVMRA